jgi:hypothetical protein
MIILAILVSLAAIGLLCWLLFTLAVFALPAFVGLTAGAWAHGTSAGFEKPWLRSPSSPVTF